MKSPKPREGEDPGSGLTLWFQPLSAGTPCLAGGCCCLRNFLAFVITVLYYIVLSVAAGRTDLVTLGSLPFPSKWPDLDKTFPDPPSQRDLI